MTLRFPLALVLGIAIMAGFAATLLIHVQLAGALLVGLLVGWLANGLPKAVAGSFLSGLLGTILAGALWGSAIPFGWGGTALGVAFGVLYGLLFGVVAAAGSLATGLLQRSRRRRPAA